MPIALNQFPTVIRIQRGTYAGEYRCDNAYADPTWSWYCDTSDVHFTIGTNRDPADRFHISYDVGNGQNDSWYYEFGNRVANPRGFKNINEITPAYRNGALGWRNDAAFRAEMRDLANQFVIRVPADLRLQQAAAQRAARRAAQIAQGAAIRAQRAGRGRRRALIDGDAMRDLFRE